MSAGRRPPHQPRADRPKSALEGTGEILDRVVAALLPATRAIDPGSAEARERRDAKREVERQIERAIWRAERRARQLPLHVRRSSAYVQKRRRQIAYEVSRAVKSLGAGEMLADAIAERAAMRYPRDGIILPDATERPERAARPRARGESPRQRARNPRALGESPRQRGQAPRQRRAAADLTSADLALAGTFSPTSTPAPRSSVEQPREVTPRAVSQDFTQAWEKQTRELMRDMANGTNVTKGMSREQREKFFAQVREIRRRDHRRQRGEDPPATST